MSSGKGGSRVAAKKVGTLAIDQIPHDVVHCLAGLYIFRPGECRGVGTNVNRVPYSSWETLQRDYPEARKCDAEA